MLKPCFLFQSLTPNGKNSPKRLRKKLKRRKETAYTFSLFLHCSKNQMILQHPHSFSGCAPLNPFQEHICFAVYMANSIIRPNCELHRCLQQNICLSFINILMTNEKTNSKNVLGQFYSARVRLHALCTHSTFSASEQLSRSKKQVSCAEQINNTHMFSETVTFAEY